MGSSGKSSYFVEFLEIHSRKLDWRDPKEVFPRIGNFSDHLDPFDNARELLVVPFRFQIWLKAAIIGLIVLPSTICSGKPFVQLPPNGPNPWTQNPPAPGYFPQWGSTLPNPVSPGFRPSTAPSAVQTTPNYGIANWFNWGQPQSLPLGTGPTYSSYNQAVPFQNPINPQGYGPPQFPLNAYPSSSPNVLFPSTSGSPPLNTTWNFQNQTNPYATPQNYYGNGWNNWWNSTSANFSYGTTEVVRLFQGPRFRHTWLSGSTNFDGESSNSIEINDTDVSLVFAIHNLFGSTRPLYIIPSYSQHEWEGPSVPGSNIPGSAFSAFLDSGWESNPVQTLGVELGVRVGVFSAFDAVNSNSIQIQGKGLGRIRLTPTSTFRAGVFYLDRNKIKLLPAIGLLWIPNPDTRFDIFFPEPKLSHYLSTVGNWDAWWYLTAYYGGGAWTIKQPDGSNDQIDINDIRVLMGLEFGKSDQIRQGFRRGFLESGIAFNRELIYRVSPTGSLNLDNSFVLRAGFAY